MGNDQASLCSLADFKQFEGARKAGKPRGAWERDGWETARFRASSPLCVFAFKLFKPPSYAGYEHANKQKKTIAEHVRYKSLYISLPSSTQQRHEITKFCVFCRTQTVTANFSDFRTEQNDLAVSDYSTRKTCTDTCNVKRVGSFLTLKCFILYAFCMSNAS